MLFPCDSSTRWGVGRSSTPDITTPMNLRAPVLGTILTGTPLRVTSEPGSKTPRLGNPTGPLSTGTPYWTTFELPAIDMKVSSVGTLDQIVAGLR